MTTAPITAADLAAVPFVLVPVAPTGSRTSLCFVSRSTDTEGEGGGMEDLELKDYPPSDHGRRLRALRVSVDPYMSLGHLARLIGLRPSEVSWLQTGRATLASEDEWERLFTLVRTTKERPVGT